MPYSRIREAPESSSAATLRAVVAALNNAWHTPQPSTPTEARLAQWAQYLPKQIVQAAVARSVRQRALMPELARYVKTEGLARQAVAHYQQVDGPDRYPAIFIGAPNGGVAYLAALLGAPFLPAHFLLSFADATDPDDVTGYYEHGAELIATILHNNPDLMAVNHYDPVHDRFLVAEVNHVRLKLLALPEAYQTFIERHLAPDGYLFYINNSYAWPQYRVGHRHRFQVGGLGGFSAREFLEGSEKLDAWLAGQRSEHRGGWPLPGYEMDEEPESEWGSLPLFGEDVREYAEAAGYAFKAIIGEHPEDFSALAYTAYLWESRLHRRTPQGLLVECFSQINPTAALRADLLPLWLPFNTDDSLDYFARMTPYIPKQLPVGLSLLANFTPTPDTPPASAWQAVAQKIGPVTWIGVHPRHYPVDIASIFDYLPDLQHWVQSLPGQEPAPRLNASDFLEMMSYLHRHGSRLFTFLLSDEDEQEEQAMAMDGP